MKANKIIVLLTLTAAMIFNMTAGAMTTKEWGRLSSQDTQAAGKVVMEAYATARAKSVDHYRKVGNTQRAEIVEKMDPNLHELFGRLHLAVTAKPDADVEDVMRGYIVDASAQLMSTSRSK